MFIVIPTKYGCRILDREYYEEVAIENEEIPKLIEDLKKVIEN